MNNAFVINLDSRREQFEEVQRSFEPYGISCERFSAIEHEEGFVGCALSHLKIIEQAKNNRWPWVMLMEDDCVAREAMNGWPAISTFLMEQAHRWDIFFGGGLYLYPKKIEYDFQEQLEKNIKLVECDQVHATHFVIYHERSYDALLAWHQWPLPLEQRLPIDVFIQGCSLRKWVPFPFIAWQKSHHSSTANKFLDCDHGFKVAEQALHGFKTFMMLSSKK